MNKLGGKVILKESGLGIPDLLVAVYDADARAVAARPAGRRLLGGNNEAAAAATFQVPSGSARLGSVLTDKAGRFQLTFDDADFRKRQGDINRPDLLLAVSPPEESEVNGITPLYVTSAARQSAGRTEEFLVRLSAEQLSKVGIPLPSATMEAAETPDQVVSRLRVAAARDETISEGMRAVRKQRLDRQRQVAQTFQAKVKPALSRALSRIPDGTIDQTSLVLPGQSVFEKTTAAIQRGILQRVNAVGSPSGRPAIKGLLALTEAQRKDLAARLGPDGRISRQDLQKALQPSADDGANRVLLREATTNWLSRERTPHERECAAALGVASAPNSPHVAPNGAATALTGESADMAGAGVATIATPDINRFVALLMETMTSPEERVLAGLEPRADRAKIEEDVQAISFPPSPADTASIFDFHNLQIAFEHVWQEAIDEGILKLAEDAYHSIVELGGNPDFLTLTTPSDAIRKLIEEGRFVSKTHSGQWSPRLYIPGLDSVVNAIEAVGDVLVDVASSAVDAVVGSTTSVAGSVAANPSTAGQFAVLGHLNTNAAQSLAENYLPSLLAALEKRLKEDYAFTIYAANRKERSINFGILVSYRQKWEPEAYQAGKLAKTLTLAPKETQRYTKKTTVHRKRSEKEVENQLRTRREEMATTSRAEQEIVRKATTKSNFDLNRKNTVEVPIEGLQAENTITTDFSREATTASDDVKKAFHEAVIKSAQEYKDEHNTEVNIEEAIDTSIEESGEITNPNDEIPVTFLFNELQRRYRVTEHLHRVTAVILVAQEVPRPDEIDEAWLVTHDWILKRVLLDDTFLPALNYLSQSVVGDEVALRELKINVNQQRGVVANLNQELASARERLAIRRNLLESALYQRSKGGLDDDIDHLMGKVVPGVALAEKALDKVGDFLFGGDDTDQTAEKNRQDALKEAMQWAADEERELLQRLEREVTALNDITETYSKKLAEHLNHRTQTARLKTHIKQNILFYMQAIWSHEPPDQRFFRLHKVRVPKLEAQEQMYTFPNLAVSPAGPVLPQQRLGFEGASAKRLFEFHAHTTIKSDFEHATLSEIADLDTPLGYKGNYMIFPLKKSNALTDYMMQPYVVAGLDAVIDPDGPGNWTLEEFSEYVCCLKVSLTEAEFACLSP